MTRRVTITISNGDSLQQRFDDAVAELWDRWGGKQCVPDVPMSKSEKFEHDVMSRRGGHMSNGFIPTDIPNGKLVV